MNEPIGIPIELAPHDVVERALIQAAKGFALLGGAALLGLIAMSLVSIVGRKLANAPITGDVEMMQAGTAAAAAALLPYCTIQGEHLRVDFFTEKAPAWLRRPLDGVADLLLALVMAVLAWRTGLQAVDIREAGEVTPLLSIPVWLPVAALVPSLALTAACAAHRAVRDFVGEEDEG
ncbi:TRAP transporter small permease [Azospirillum sp.]|uniref:TRAP transporter small permease n=1 Tax=Azospirillum sp. TaxID=34012 RepID=UPI002D344038|nr:TRAP transporter small permease [Azospirillum sp.]HYD68754.1 TRAP transporter small permease [Azospirillum sp.]